MDSLAWQETWNGFSIILAICYNHLNLYQPRVRMWFQRNVKSEQFLEIVYPRQKWFQIKRYSIGNMRWSVTFLDLAKLSIREEAALATNWIKNRHEGLNLQNLALATMTSLAVAQSTEKYDCRCPVRHNKCEIVGLKETIDPSRESIGNCKGFLSAYGSPSTFHFLPNMHAPVLHVLLQGITLGGDFNIFVANGESTSWVLLLKNRSRPIGVRVCPVAQLNFFSTAFYPCVSGQWLCSGKKVWDVSPSWLHLKTEEDIIPIIHLRQPILSLMILDVPFGPSGPPAPPETHESHGFPGLPPGWPPAPSPAGGRERVGTGYICRVSDCIRDLHHPRLN